jgi:hypothetical protein
MEHTRAKSVPDGLQACVEHDSKKRSWKLMKDRSKVGTPEWVMRMAWSSLSPLIDRVRTTMNLEKIVAIVYSELHSAL